MNKVIYIEFVKFNVPTAFSCGFVCGAGVVTATTVVLKASGVNDVTPVVVVAGLTTLLSSMELLRRSVIVVRRPQTRPESAANDERKGPS